MNHPNAAGYAGVFSISLHIRFQSIVAVAAEGVSEKLRQMVGLSHLHRCARNMKQVCVLIGSIWLNLDVAVILRSASGQKRSAARWHLVHPHETGSPRQPGR